MPSVHNTHIWEVNLPPPRVAAQPTPLDPLKLNQYSQKAPIPKNSTLFVDVRANHRRRLKRNAQITAGLLFLWDLVYIIGCIVIFYHYHNTFNNDTYGVVGLLSIRIIFSCGQGLWEVFQLKTTWFMVLPRLIIAGYEIAMLVWIIHDGWVVVVVFAWNLVHIQGEYWKMPLFSNCKCYTLFAWDTVLVSRLHAVIMDL
uniref:Uncharacterized protein n=1 Tax=Caenorhabditis japonica TaxID=281687 RepID=A0A8R1HH10_CAEJA